MFKIIPHNLHWLGKDETKDQCAHGGVQVEFEDKVFLTPEVGDWNLSATGLYLLRTLERSHTEKDSVTERFHFIPCCAHDIYPYEKSRYGFVMTGGCGNGFDIEVVHNPGSGSVVAKGGGYKTTLEFKDWEAIVAKFTNEIERFYLNSKTKSTPTDSEEKLVWGMYWEEWEMRRGSVAT